MNQDLAPEGIQGTCMYCGRRLTGEVTAYHVEIYGADELLARFCSEECARAQRMMIDESWEEFDEADQIDRAGAT